MKNRLRLGLSIGIVLVTIAAFAFYLSRHSYLLKQLTHTPPLTIIWILLLYLAILAVLGLVLSASLRICRISMKPQENFLLNAYSLLANFFVIGQVGPGVRAAYLKKHYKLLIRKYLYVTLIYYACYALISVFLILMGSTVSWWLTILIVLLIGGASLLTVRFYVSRHHESNDHLNLNLSTISYLALATLLQLTLQVIIYKIELHSVNSHISFKQTMAYTGIANLALFVGLTPGAIGIRETFLVFSEKLHHIGSANIVAANIIDRSVYILFLAILFFVTIGFHAKTKYSDKDSKEKDQL